MIKPTPAMTSQVLDAATKAGYRVCMAPFEADVQLAYLCRMGAAQGVLGTNVDTNFFTTFAPTHLLARTHKASSRRTVTSSCTCF